LLHSSSGGIQNGILAITENHLTNDGKSEGIGSRLRIDKSQDGVGSVTEIGDEPPS
jgi:hypothetical protein